MTKDIKKVDHRKNITVVNYKDYVYANVDNFSEELAKIVFPMIDQRAQMAGAKSGHLQINLGWLEKELPGIITEAYLRIANGTGAPLTMANRRVKELERELLFWKRVMEHKGINIEKWEWARKEGLF